MKYMQQKSKAQEERLAKKHKGRRQPGSGCGPQNKGDVKTERFLIEAKCTDKQSFTLTERMVDKINDQAMRQGKEPLIQLDLGKYSLYIMLEHSFDGGE